MNKKCGKCSKTVYPTEELKCLDKVWHKACFKCQVCNMTLNMKNYKGYDKFPYCNAHYPTTKPTAVADTPEGRRIAQNTKIQSNIKYHEQFEKEKGAKISVADDPELERLKRNTQVVSNVAYHNTLQQKFQQDANRPLDSQDFNAARNRRNPGSISDYNPPVEASPASARSQPTNVYNSKGEEYNQQPARRQIGSIADYDPMNAPGFQSSAPQQQQQPRNPALYSPTPYSPPGQFSSKQRQIGSVPGPMSNMSNMGAAPGQGYQYGQPAQPAQPQGSMYVPFRPQEGTRQSDGQADIRADENETDDKLAESIQILDDLEKSLSGNDVFSDSTPPQPHDPIEPRAEPQHDQGFQTTYPVPGYDTQGSSRNSYTNDYPPSQPDMQGSRNSYSNNYPASAPDMQGSRNSYTNNYPASAPAEVPPVDDGYQDSDPSQLAPPSPPPVEPEPDSGDGFRTTYPTEEPAPQPAKASRGVVSQAMYDYTAADTDEVSFMENDLVINCEPVDEGWMYGTVERTGQRGMLPSNYVQRVN